MNSTRVQILAGEHLRPCVIVAALTGFVALSAGCGQDSPKPVVGPLPSNAVAWPTGASVPTVRFQTDVPINGNDLKAVVGFADSVFVGVVNDRTEGVVRFRIPWTNATVRVTDGIKGAFSGNTVRVEQQGGYDRASGEYVLGEEETLLEPGRSYIFSTRHSAQRGTEVVIARYGLVLVDPNEGAGAATVKRWREAAS